MRKRLIKLSLLQLLVSVVTFGINYLVYHFVTDEGFTSVWQAEVGKPFVSMLIGVLATLVLFGSAVTAMSAFVIFDRK